jgi:iron(III) transport system permease protein
MATAADTATTASPVRAVRQALGRDDVLMRLGLAALAGGLLIIVVFPLWALLSKSLESADGRFAGLANFVAYARAPTLAASVGNSITIALVSTLLCVLLAFLFAYGIMRTCLPGRGLFATVAQIPILAPSLLPAISLVYLFGNQGAFKAWLFGHSIYGPIGIVAGEVFWTFPHALLIIGTALSISDARLYEAAAALKASPWRTFLTVTVPGARYGLISATFAVFTLVITDFGVPKVIGGQYNVLATDIYKQVVGQQNFQMGAVVGVVLLVPAVIAFAVDRFVQRRQVALLSSRAVPYTPRPHGVTDGVFFAICAVIALAIVAMMAVALLASVATFWPYNLTPTLKNYRFDMVDGGGWESYRNSVVMAAATALLGTAVIFTGAYLLEKARGLARIRAVIQFMALLPLAVPGLVLGLGYVFFFNDPGNPLGFIYGTMTILALSSIAHFYSVAHLTGITALKQIDPEFETVSASLRVPVYRTFCTVTLPICLPAVLDIAMYLFVNAMTTVSAVIFLYAPDTTLAAVAVLNMDDAGDVAPAAAMAMMIFGTSTVVRVAYGLVTQRVLGRVQRWRRR